MNIRLLRAWLTGVAMTLALLMTSGVLAWQLTAPVQAGGSAAAADNGEYLLVDQAGQICIYSDGSLISNTGIPVRALPELDRIALAQGIHAKGQPAAGRPAGGLRRIAPQEFCISPLLFLPVLATM